MWIDDAAVVVDHHLLVERGAERLGDAALDLAAALHGVGDAAGIGRLHALQDLDLAGALVHGDAKALHVEGDRARRAAELPLAPSVLPSAARGRGEQRKGRSLASGARPWHRCRALQASALFAQQ